MVSPAQTSTDSETDMDASKMPLDVVLPVALKGQPAVYFLIVVAVAYAIWKVC